MKDGEETPFSHWNYRVIRVEEVDGSSYYQIHECYYGDDDKIPHSWTKDPIRVGGESVDDLAWDLDEMKKALSKPALEEVDNKLREV